MIIYSNHPFFPQRPPIKVQMAELFSVFRFEPEYYSFSVEHVRSSEERCPKTRRALCIRNTSKESEIMNACEGVIVWPIVLITTSTRHRGETDCSTAEEEN